MNPDPSTIGGIGAAVVAVIAAVLGGLKAIQHGVLGEMATAEKAMLDRIEELTLSLDTERERAEGLEGEVFRLQMERTALDGRIAVLEGQVQLLLGLLRQPAIEE